MKKKIIILGMSFLLAGCSCQERPIDKINLGMQVFQVQELSLKLEPVASKENGDIDIAQYRGWFSKKYTVSHGLIPVRKPYPYLLTFNVHPPLTKEDCNNLSNKMNISDPNQINEIMALQGYRPTRLVEIQPDNDYLLRQSISNSLRRSYQPPQNNYEAPKMQHAVPDYTGGYWIHGN